jgi:hypothetical protein
LFETINLADVLAENGLEDVKSLLSTFSSKYDPDLSGKYAYIECADTPKLIAYYERNEFRRIDDGDPAAVYDTTMPYLVQMLKYFS